MMAMRATRRFEIEVLCDVRRPDLRRCHPRSPRSQRPPPQSVRRQPPPDAIETSRERLTERHVRCHELPACEAPPTGRLQVGILGAIKSECLGDFVGIGILAARAIFIPSATKRN